MDTVVLFFQRLILLLSKAYTYVVEIILTPFGLAMTDGLMEKFVVMIVIMTIAIFADFFLKFIHVLLLTKKEKVKSDKMGNTVTKLVAAYFPFLVLSLVTFISLKVYPAISMISESATFTLFILVVTRELLSLLETAEKMGLPGAKRVMDIINSLPDLFIKKGGK
ncbi:phage holin family protein [Paenibacillus sp. TAB 01]|uniref:phage holin family protein n=1 Tax=Paenibacillus sp. TAB 01 TaxID=3368988 RepID=UPI0037525E1D